MPAPSLELDERWFEVLARSDRAVLTRHRISGKLSIWELRWRSGHEHNFEPAFTSHAWAEYMRLSTEG